MPLDPPALSPGTGLNGVLRDEWDEVLLAVHDEVDRAPLLESIVPTRPERPERLPPSPIGRNLIQFVARS